MAVWSRQRKTRRIAAQRVHTHAHLQHACMHAEAVTPTKDFALEKGAVRYCSTAELLHTSKSSPGASNVHVYAQQHSSAMNYVLHRHA